MEYCGHNHTWNYLIVCCKHFYNKIYGILRCDLLERPQEELSWKDDGLELEFKPFEIITLICFLSNT
jgi:hypothetical protein